MIQMQLAKVGGKCGGKVLCQDRAVDMVGKLNDQARKGDLVRMLHPDGKQVRLRIIRAWIKGDKVMVQVETPNGE